MSLVLCCFGFVDGGLNRSLQRVLGEGGVACYKIIQQHITDALCNILPKLYNAANKYMMLKKKKWLSYGPGLHIHPSTKKTQVKWIITIEHDEVQ